MEQKKIGYIAIQFTPETNQEVVKWSQNLKKEDLVTATVDGKTEGGNVTNKLHLTLFYGFDDEIVNKSNLLEYINQIALKEIKASGPSLFFVKEYDCDVLHLKVRDDGGELKKIHEELKEFAHFPEYQKFEYTPHVSIAYVKKDFNIDKLTENLPEILRVDKVQYILSSSTERNGVSHY